MTAAIMGYFGSKHRLADRLIALMPEHRGYVEPFAGSLSVLARKAPAAIEVVNDLNADLMTFWRVLRDRPEDLERACILTPHAREEHRDSFNLRPHPYDEVEHARRVWVRLAQGRAGQFTPTGWRHHQSTQKVGSGGMAYDELYADWHRVELSAWTGQGNQRAARTEVAWCNRPPTISDPGLPGSAAASSG